MLKRTKIYTWKAKFEKKDFILLTKKSEVSDFVSDKMLQKIKDIIIESIGIGTCIIKATDLNLF